MMRTEDVNRLVYRASRIATRYAMNGTPLKGIHWIPPSTATQDPDGSFAVEFAQPRTGSSKPDWEDR